jgi:hypothetical protein
MNTINQFVEVIFPAMLKSRAINGFSFKANDSERDSIVKKHLKEIDYLNYLTMLKGRFNVITGLNTMTLKNVFNPFSLKSLFENYDTDDELKILLHLKEIAKLEFSEFIEGYLNQSNDEEFETFGAENILYESHIKAIVDLIADEKLNTLYNEKRKNRSWGNIKEYGFFD